MKHIASILFATSLLSAPALAAGTSEAAGKPERAAEPPGQPYAPQASPERMSPEQEPAQAQPGTREAMRPEARERSDQAKFETRSVTELGSYLAKEEPSQVRAERLLGLRVVNPEGQKIGEIEDLILDDDGRLVGAVISVGGFLGIGEKQVAMPWTEFDVDAESQVALVTRTKEELEQAPPFTTREEAQRAERQTELTDEAMRTQDQTRASGAIGTGAAGTGTPGGTE